jgi:hypothetical protein
MMRDRIRARQRVETARDAWLIIKITGMYLTLAMFAVLYIFVILKFIGVI